VYIITEGNYSNYDTTETRFEILNFPENTRWYEYTDPENSYYNKTGFSFEQQASRLIRDNQLNYVYVIKSSEGALTLSNWLDSNNNRWKELRRYVEFTIDYCNNNNIVPLFLPLGFMQGESNAYNSDTTNYYNQLDSFINKVRSIDPILSNLEFIFFKFPGYVWGGRNQSLAIQADFDSIADLKTGCYIIETWDLTDDYLIGNFPGHYSYESQLKLGQRYYDKCVELGYLDSVQQYLSYPDWADISSLPINQVIWDSLINATSDTNTITFTGSDGAGVSLDTVARDSIICEFYIPETTDFGLNVFGLEQSQTLVSSYNQIDYYIYNGSGSYYTKGIGVGETKSNVVCQDFDKIRFRISGSILYMEILREFYDEYGWMEINSYNYIPETYYIQVRTNSGIGKIVNVLYE
jgi:hypothetical protein